MNDIAELTVKINSEDAKTASANLDQLAKSGKGAADSSAVMQSAFERLAIVLGPTALAGAIAIAVKGSIELQESWVRLSEIAGTTSEKISSLDLPARLAGTSLDAVAQSVARLSKSIGEAQFGDTQKRGFFKALGIDPDSARDSVDTFVQVSKALTSFKDQNLAAIVSQNLLQRGFAEMRPVMKEIAESGGLVARATNEQNQAAKELADTWTKIGVSASNTRMAMAEGMLPALQGVSNAFKELEGNSDLARAAGSALGEGIKIIAELAIRAGTEVYAFGNYVGGLAAIAQALMERDGSKAMAIAKDIDERIAGIYARSEKLLAALSSARTSAGGKPGGGGASEEGGAGDGPSEAEKRAKTLADFQKYYEARLAALKGFNDQIASYYKVQQQITGEHLKQSLMSEEEYLKRIGDIENARLRVQLYTLEQEKKMYEQRGDLGKTAEAAAQIQQTNALIVANEELTQEKIRTARDQTQLAWQRDLEMRRAALVEEQLSEFERLQAWLVERENMLEQWRGDNEEREQEYGIRLANIYAEYENRRTEILDKQEKQRWGIQKIYHTLNAESMNAFLGYVSVAMTSKNREMFEVAKAAATGQAIMNTYNAANGAYSAMAPIPYVGPILGAIAAGAAIAAGLANVQAIQSQHMGGGSAGGGAPAVPTFSASPTTGLPTNSPAPDQGQQSPTTIVNLHGKSFDDEQIRDLFERINENTRNGGRVLVQ